ncbi:hypothetical protein TYRP_016838 [Tyrophagus putrescentiae]|nr:hypothetical protein TYRP_016838 [Tyrophagus putrescentiae]
MHLRRVSRKWRENIENICQLLDCMDIVDAYYAGDRGFEQAMVLKRERSSRHRKVVSTVVTRTEDRGRFLATLFPGIKHFARYCYLQSRDRLTTLDWPALVRSWAPQLVSLDIDGNTANQLTEADFFKKELAFPALTEFILREGRSIVFITPMLVHSLLDKMRSLRRLTTGQMVTNAWAIRSVTHLSINMSSMRSYDGDAIQMAARYTKLTHLNLIYYVFNYQIYRSLSETLQQLPNLRVIAFSVNIFREGAVNEAFFEGGPSGASVVNLQFSNTWFWLQFDAEDERFIRIVGRFVTMFPNVQKMTFPGPGSPEHHGADESSPDNQSIERGQLSLNAPLIVADESDGNAELHQVTCIREVVILDAHRREGGHNLGNVGQHVEEEGQREDIVQLTVDHREAAETGDQSTQTSA